jgi:deoxyhypusine monooxygenase
MPPSAIRELLAAAEGHFKQREARRHELQSAIAAKSAVVARLTFAKATRDAAKPIAARMRAVFYLRTLNTDEAALLLVPALFAKSDSVLLRHEVAFCLGQMGRSVVVRTCSLARADSAHAPQVPHLIRVLNDDEDDVIVRHEAAEALGAIGDLRCLPALQTWATQGPVEVQETCAIALDKLQKAEAEGAPSTFLTVDPAPAAPPGAHSVAELQRMLVGEGNISLYERYRAMFALRNRGDEQAVLALAHGFSDPSALFRHEIAYVMGQLAHPASIPALSAVLRNEAEHEMVRHEAAEALGAIGDDECVGLLRQFQTPAVAQIVRESCDVALDAAAYWEEFEQPAVMDH